jgi:hypothetical protein
MGRANLLANSQSVLIVLWDLLDCSAIILFCVVMDNLFLSFPFSFVIVRLRKIYIGGIWMSNCPH